MLRILQQFTLTTIFAIFASQAAAMFIQPDWYDPTKPGVGTNRYSYSHNDPINQVDPGGNESYIVIDRQGFVGQHVGTVVRNPASGPNAIYDPNGSYQYNDTKVIGGDSIHMGTGRMITADDGSVYTDRGRTISIDSVIRDYLENCDAAEQSSRDIGVFGLGTTDAQDQAIIDSAEQLGGGGFFDCSSLCSTAVSSVPHLNDLAGTMRPRALYNELSKLAEQGLVEKLSYDEFLDRLDRNEYKDEPSRDDDISTRDNP